MEDARFIATKELGKLVKWMRVLGYDCIYYEDKKEGDLIIQALRDRRTLLTRTERLKKYIGIKVVIIKHDNVEDQIEQVVEDLTLDLDDERFFQRCVECNVELFHAAKNDIKNKVPEYVFETQEEFKECPACKKVFWRGTHWDNVGEKIEEMRRKFKQT